MIAVAIALSIALITAGAAPDFVGLIEGDLIGTGLPNKSAGSKNVNGGELRSTSNPPVRIPAEWEPQAATWMQWPRASESWLRPNFSAIINVLRNYEPVNIIVESSAARSQAQNFLTGEGVPLSNITWHIMDYDWAWMRDNGPVWSVETGEQIVQNWGFNGWGLGPPYADDDAVPCRVAAIEGVPCETYQMINERGNLEFNGAGALIANWVCQSSRNPGVSQSETETLFQQAFGLTRIVWLLSEPSDDITNGHVDGIARFIDEDTVAVARYVSQTDPDAPVYEEAASIIQNAGFEIVRVDMPGYVMHNGDPLPANYLNWLVANGVVIVPGFGVPAWDAAARATIAGFFPDRDVVMVDILDIWAEGGGVHCVTNDQPVPPATSSTTDSGDYNGDGISDIAIFRGSSGLWAVRGITLLYFGSADDLPVSGDYNGNGTADIAIFRESTGLWAVRGVTRSYFGSSLDTAIPRDYDGDGSCDAGIFRESSGLWALRGVTRVYFGTSGDTVVPGDYNGNGTKDIGIFRESSGLWALRNISRVYFGSSNDYPLPGDFDGDGTWEVGIFRPSTGLWAIRGVTRAYFGGSSDQPVPADYNGDLSDDIGIFRDTSGLWAIRSISRLYFGTSGDIPVTR